MSFDELFEKVVVKHEGYYANVSGDKGGETYMGIARKHHSGWLGWNIIDDYKSNNDSIKHNQKLEVPELTQLVKDFYRYAFYHKYGIEYIENSSLQEIIFDWCINSGYWGSVRVQKVLNRYFDHDLLLDGKIGRYTLSAINSTETKTLFIAIKNERIRHYHTIAKKGHNGKFLKGWLRRIEGIIYK